MRSGLDYGDAMQCPSCTAEVLEGSRFCNSCGAALPVRCRECAHSNAAGSRFCANCGARLTGDGLTTLAAAPKPAPPPPFDAAERRHVTVMFCDLVGSTALSEQLDPEDLRAVIAAYYREVAAEVRRFGGFVARHTSAMACWSISAIRPRMRMMRSVRFAPGWR